MSLRSLLSAFSTYAAKGLLSSASYVVGEDRDDGFFLWAVKRTAQFLLMFGGRFVPRIWRLGLSRKREQFFGAGRNQIFR